jgi:hypothetical protein
MKGLATKEAIQIFGRAFYTQMVERKGLHMEIWNKQESAVKCGTYQGQSTRSVSQIGDKCTGQTWRLQGIAEPFEGNNVAPDNCWTDRVV